MQTVFDANVDATLIVAALAPSVPGSMWPDVPRPRFERLTGAVSADLVIVVAGYTGLWTALHAAERRPGTRIVGVESDRVAGAASGRNGGFVDASVTHGPENGNLPGPTRSSSSSASAWTTSTGCRPTSTG